MALRDQPYLPLYIQDIMTDEKLNECSASTHGIYIKGIMCLMHKSETYGKLLLQQKHKQTGKQKMDFATMIARHLPYTETEVLAAIGELIDQKVCFIEGDFLVQKRMVKDNELSEKRAKAGKKGGDTTNNPSNPKGKFAVAKTVANSEIEYEDENISENGFKEGVQGKPLEGDEFKNEVKEAIAKEFGLNEIAHFRQIVDITLFVNVTFGRFGYRYVIDTITAYRKFKELTGQHAHGFKGFIGTNDNDFADGGWNSDNWQFKIDNYKPAGQPKSKIKEIIEVSQKVVNPFRNE